MLVTMGLTGMTHRQTDTQIAFYILMVFYKLCLIKSISAVTTIVVLVLYDPHMYIINRLSHFVFRIRIPEILEIDRDTIFSRGFSLNFCLLIWTVFGGILV